MKIVDLSEMTNETRKNGNYLIKGYYSLAQAIVPEYSKELFPKFRDLEKKANVLVYIDEDRMDAERDSTRYLALKLAQDSYFRVGLAINPDAELAKYADIVIPRFNPPVNEEFLGELEKYNDGSRLFINPPEAQEYFSNKRYLEDIAKEHPEILPKTIVSSNPSELGKFMYELRKTDDSVVYKPVRGFGGDGISRFKLNGDSLEGLINLGSGLSQGQEIILQEFIKNVSDYGDKRIHIVDGKPIGALLRVPQDGDWICNQKKGARLEETDITDSDYEILEKINPFLREYEVFWAGIDIVGPYLGEINAVSPGLLYAVDEFSGASPAIDYFSEIIKEEIQDRAMEVFAV